MDPAQHRQSMRRRWSAFLVAIIVLTAVPVVVVAADRFTDVSNSNVHHDDITWLADAGVTLGCNPPANDRFCPEQPVLRQQMASFLRRLAENQVVDAATAVEAAHAATAVEAAHAATADEAQHAVTAGRASSAPGTLVAITSLDVTCASLSTGDRTYRKVLDVGAFEKVDDDSTLVLTFNGRVSADAITAGNGAIFELRVDDAATTTGRARMHMKTSDVSGAGVQGSMKGIFDGLSAGTHTVSVWAQTGISGAATGLRVDPGCWSSDHVVVEEYAAAT